MAITASLVSLAIGKGMKKEIAMTGEISLKGKVLKIGGIILLWKRCKREGISSQKRECFKFNFAIREQIRCRRFKWRYKRWNLI